MIKEEKVAWKEGLEKPEFPKLTQNLSTDVVIVGGGLAGVLTAYLLAKAGKQVVLLEKKKIGSGATEYTTAFITQAIDTDLPVLAKLFGDEKLKLVWQSGADAIDLIEKIVNEEKIECEFTRCDVTVFASKADQYQNLQEEQETAYKYGFDVSPISQFIQTSFTNFGGYKIHNQAKFHPLKFLFSLAKITEDLGVKIYQESEVTKIKHEDSKVIVGVSDSKVEAKAVVVATYQPLHNRIRLFLKRGMYRSFVMAVKLPPNLIQEGLYWDTENPYHYFRVDQDQMILGGEDVKSIFKFDKEKSFTALEEYLKSILPGVNYEITHRWIGPLLEPSDGLPLIGQTYENEYVATAFSGNGMTYSAISAMINSDLIMGYQNIYAKVYDPKRIPSLKQLFIKGTDYIEEFFGGAAKNMFRKTGAIPS